MIQFTFLKAAKAKMAYKWTIKWRRMLGLLRGGAIAPNDEEKDEPLQIAWTLSVVSGNLSHDLLFFTICW